jgi:glycosyltransferase involved in cell wall biosynthesis
MDGACRDGEGDKADDMPDSQDAAHAHDDAKISLVVATLGRRDELARLLDSLNRQTRPPHQVIIVDQNPSGWLDDTLSTHTAGLPLLHLRSAKGASLARNVGLASATGDIIGFPDDDCWLQPELLARVAIHFSPSPHLAVACLPLHDETDRPIMLRWPVTRTPVTRHNVWQTCLMAGFFVRRSVMETTHGFDETIGVGSSGGLTSGEETDLALRLLAGGHQIEFVPITGLHHPARPPVAALAGRAEAYGRGFGHVWARHHLSTAGFYYYCLRTIGGYLLARFKGDHGACHYYAASLKGRLTGRRTALKERA